ncbi:hypothetical protein AB4Z54_43415, partial [Streptomyces sp. MCAF7]
PNNSSVKGPAEAEGVLAATLSEHFADRGPGVLDRDHWMATKSEQHASNALTRKQLGRRDTDIRTRQAELRTAVRVP